MTRTGTSSEPRRGEGGEVEVYLLAQRPGPDRRAEFSGPEARHISRVKRHRTGDRVLATDGQGTRALNTKSSLNRCWSLRLAATS